jgi:ribosomal protein S7
METLSINTINYFQKMKQFFLRKGNKAAVENLFYSLLKNRASNGKDSIVNVLNNCILNGTSFVQLKTKRRGKRVIYKIGYMEHERAERKALGTLAKTINDQSSGNFLSNLEKELEALSVGKSNISAKRDEIHQIALENTPYAWLSSSKKRRNKKN